VAGWNPRRPTGCRLRPANGGRTPTKSIRLTDEEADELRQLRAETGEDEDALLRRAALRGLRDLRLDQGIQAFQAGRGSSAAAAVAGLPRAVFLEVMLDRGVTILEGPSTLSGELEGLARRLGDDRLTEIARGLSPPP